MPDKILYEANNLPVLQNRTFATLKEAISSPQGDFRLVEDEMTGLIYNDKFDDSKLIYDDSYQNEQALSPAFQKHLDDVIDVIKRNFKSDKFLEIGCGKGHFLNLLQDMGYDAIGVDPSYEGSSEYIVKSLYTSELGIFRPSLILRHVLEHIKNPFDFLKTISSSNGHQGLIYIEVPCFDWICSRNAWFDLYYEHVNYFRLSDFSKFFSEIVESGSLFAGQYIYAVADLATLIHPSRHEDELAELPTDFTLARDQYETLPKAPRAIWGAASKGVIFAMHLKNLGINVDMAIDINPAKQDRFLPCSGVKVVSPETAISILPEGSEIFIMNSNYADEIRALAGDRFTYLTVDG